jgi:hypothetical protein
MTKWKDLERHDCGLVFMYYATIHLLGLRKPTKNALVRITGLGDKMCPKDLPNMNRKWWWLRTYRTAALNLTKNCN